MIRDAVSDTASAIKVSLGGVDSVLDFFCTTNVVMFPMRPKVTSKHDTAPLT